MAKKIAVCLLALLLSCPAALADMTVERNEGEAYYPNEKNWVYHFTYAYPHLIGDSYTVALINDTYEMALDEVKDIALPMFANAPDMRYDGKNEVSHDFSVVCNTPRLLSILLRQSQTVGEEGVRLTLEAQTFNVDGETEGDLLTLRGVILMLSGVATDRLYGEVTAEDAPSLPRIVAGSSDGIGEALLPVLYAEFQRMQETGAAPADAAYEDFEAEFLPTRDFYALPDGRVAFFFPPMLLKEPSFDVPVFPFTPEELEALL